VIPRTNQASLAIPVLVVLPRFCDAGLRRELCFVFILPFDVNKRGLDLEVILKIPPTSPLGGDISLIDSVQFVCLLVQNFMQIKLNLEHK
jgi:hypothetical protein